MKKVKFPINNGQRYYDIHFKYIENIFKYLDYDIEYYLAKDDELTIILNNKKILFDYWDSDECRYLDRKDIDYIFKFHYNYSKKYENKVFSFTPISFYDWNNYFELERKIVYQADGYISNRQVPYGGALERRRNVQKLLKANFSNVETKVINQMAFWTDIENILVSVCIPGFCNNMLDRGQLQYMAYGACTISPKLPEVLPFGKCLFPDIHYIQCKDDYSDLVDIIKNLNKYKCIEIGLNAKQLFLNTSTPKNLETWILNNINYDLLKLKEK